LEIYEDIEMLANLGKRIKVMYSSELHYPIHAHCVLYDGFGHFCIQAVNDFVLNPDLSDETVGEPELWPDLDWL
jgi:hypothetical protein